ncbi:MAG: peptidoglycan editing factor PgeF [Bacteroidales bacterium]
MIATETNGIQLYSFQLFSSLPKLRHFVSTRHSGVSSKNFSSLNMGFHVGDNNFNVLRNRNLLSAATRIDILRFTCANQCHSGNVVIVDESSRGKGSVDKESAIPNTDGMITNVERICLGVQIADCVPILLYDPKERVIAALHSGWKGALRKIAARAVEKMIQSYGSKAENILAGLGPSNGPCCYEVGPEVVHETETALGSTRGVIKPAGKQGKFIFDQWQANTMQLLEMGLQKNHIEVAELCTQCHSETFFSSRADSGVTGRFMAGIMLEK